MSQSQRNPLALWHWCEAWSLVPAVAVLPLHLRSHGKRNSRHIGLILLTRKPAPTCAHGFRVKTLKTQSMASPAPAENSERRKRWRTGDSSGEFVMALSRCPSRRVVPGPNSLSVPPRGCSSRSCRAPQRCQSSIPTPQGLLAVQFLTAPTNSIQGSPPPPWGSYDPTPQSFKVGFSDYFVPTVISPES